MTNSIQHTLKISSDAFMFDQPIPDRYTSVGAGSQPALFWSGVPNGAVELALRVHDPDSLRVDGFTHWVVTAIDSSSTGLAMDIGCLQAIGVSSTGDRSWIAPAPPAGHGVHHYFFHLYALDIALGDTVFTGPQLLGAIDGHVIAQARLVGTFAVA